MNKDIIAINVDGPINNKSVIASVGKTGKTNKYTIRPNYPASLTIEAIQSKYFHRFDDVSYYYGNGQQNTKQPVT
jgi:hypothetical protein